MLAQNRAFLSWCGDSGTTTARAVVGAAVGDVISMLIVLTLTLYTFATNCTLCPAANLPIAFSRWFLDNRGIGFTSK